MLESLLLLWFFFHTYQSQSYSRWLFVLQWNGVADEFLHLQNIWNTLQQRTEIDPKRSEILLTHSQIELVYTEEREIEMIEMETDQHLTNSHKYKTNSISFQYANWSKRSSDSVFIR